MPVPDDEPQYWLRDSNGDVVGALYLDADGNPAIVDENGNEASLESDGTWDVPAVSTDELSSKSNPASYHIHTDGTNISATPQPNPAGSSLAKVTGTDIGTVMTEVIVNNLPPQGSSKEAAGKILVKRGEYPGDFSNVPLPTGCHIEGEGHTHKIDTPDSAQPQTEALVKFNSTGDAFVAPNVDTDLATFCSVRGIQLEGPGASTSASGFSNQNRTNSWDWLVIEDVVVQNFGVPLDFRNSHHVYCHRVHPIYFSDIYGYADKMWFYKCGFYSEIDSTIRLSPLGRAIFESNIVNNGAASSSVSQLVCYGRTYVHANKFLNKAGTVGSAIEISGNGDFVKGNEFPSGAAWDDTILVSGGNDALIAYNRDFADSSNSINFAGSSATDPRVESNTLRRGVSVVTSPTRFLKEGIGTNGANDPAVGGDWNGNEFEGLWVKWNDGSGNDYMSVYRTDQWWDISLT